VVAPLGDSSPGSARFEGGHLAERGSARRGHPSIVTLVIPGAGGELRAALGATSVTLPPGKRRALARGR